jgi:hypothetical protein
MKFIDAWDSIAKENKLLKFLVMGLSLVSIFLCVVCLKTVSRDPLVIERGCFSKAAENAGVAVTDAEIKAFLKEAMEARFSTSAINTSFLSLKQKEIRDREQKELTSRNMKQAVLVQDVSISKDKIEIKADRLVSVGEIRSAFSFMLKVQIERSDRTLDNPYGLILSEVELIKKDGEQ